MHQLELLFTTANRTYNSDMCSHILRSKQQAPLGVFLGFSSWPQYDVAAKALHSYGTPPTVRKNY